MHLNEVSTRHQKYFARGVNEKYRFNCQWLGDFHASRILSEPHRSLGEVISVFETTINVRTDNDELLVVTLGKVRSPINMNVLPILKEKEAGEGEERSGFRGIIDFGSEVKIEKNEMLIGDVIFWLSKSRIFCSALKRLPAANALFEFTSKCNEIFNILKTHARRGCLLAPDITTKGLLSKFVKELYSYRYGSTNIFNATSAAMISGALLELIGRGPGYTPAGDDFVAGYLTVFNWISESLNFDSIMLPTNKFAPLTSWMSSKLIEYNNRGLCDEEVRAIISSIAAGDFKQYISYVAKISHRGHTSGIDIAIGMTVALYTIIDGLFETNVIARFLSWLDHNWVLTKGIEDEDETQIKSGRENE